MQTDSLFYRFFQLYPALLFELLVLPREMADHYQFSCLQVSQMSREEIGKMFSTQDLRKTRFYQEVVQEGIQQGEAEFALRLLHRKVGTLPENVTTEIRSLSTEQLEELAEALLEFERLENLTTWLSQRETP